jgi:APA family basic amino acid/polyamine antiporter
MEQNIPDIQTELPVKLGNKIFRPSRVNGLHLRRVLGIPGLFSAGYGDVGSSIYYGLGLIAIVALGATPIVLAIAGIIYVFNALTYAEGGAMLPEAGGSASFARSGYNDLIGFIAGWALMLSYIVTMAISAYTIPPYLAYFWPSLKDPVIGTSVSMGIILFLMVLNVVGIKESSRINIVFIALDILTQVTLVVLGVLLLLIPHPGLLFQNMFGAGNWPSTTNFIFGIAIAALCFTGVETVSQLGEETRRPEKRIPQTYIFMILAVLVLFAGISVVALSAMTPQELGDPVNGWARDPVAGIANSLSRIISPEAIAMNITSEPAPEFMIKWAVTGLRNLLPILVSLLAASILLTATNAGLMGISRLTFNLSSHQQLPASLKKVHHHFRTPFVSIILFCLISVALLAPGLFAPSFFTDLGSLYVFGSLLCFALAHASILALRVKKPDMTRPFKLRLNIRIKGRQLPVTALLGLVATTAVWIIILFTQPYSRWAGLIWMVIGVTVYLVFRRVKRLPVFHLPGKRQEQISESRY